MSSRPFLMASSSAQPPMLSWLVASAPALSSTCDDPQAGHVSHLGASTRLLPPVAPAACTWQHAGLRPGCLPDAHCRGTLQAWLSSAARPEQSSSWHLTPPPQFRPLSLSVTPIVPVGSMQLTWTTCLCPRAPAAQLRLTTHLGRAWHALGSQCSGRLAPGQHLAVAACLGSGERHEH